MPLIKNGLLVDDGWTRLSDDDALPSGGPVIVGLTRWKEDQAQLLARGEPLGLLLKSDEHPEGVATDLEHFELVALEFPVFGDGRPYSHARLLRERYGFTGELRAVGDVLVDQLMFMARSGFDAFEIDRLDALEQWAAAKGEFDVWYQPTADGRTTVMELRRRGRDA